MVNKKLESAFTMTREEHNRAFERFANAFLVDDYPELEALGGKHDKAMDARIIVAETGKVSLVVQSCVSPTKTARAKILATVDKLDKSNLPTVLAYCTPAKIGLALDATKQEL